MVIDAKSSALSPPEAEIVPPPDARPGVPATAARRLRGRRAAWVAPIALGVGILLFWEFLAHVVRVSPLILPTPESVVAAFWASARDGTMLAAVATTLEESLAGFALGACVALPVGYAVARSRWFAWALQPYIAASQALPAVALAPLLLVWLPLGLLPIAVLGALIVFFPAAIATTLGLRSLDHEVLDAARIDGADRWTLLRFIEWPLALPAILAGLRTSVTLSVTGAVVGEFVLGSSGFGLGSLLTIALSRLDMPLIFALLLALALLAAVLYGGARLVERRVSYLEER